MLLLPVDRLAISSVKHQQAVAEFREQTCLDDVILGLSFKVQGAYRTLKVVFHDFPGASYVHFPGPIMSIFHVSLGLFNRLIEWILNKLDFHIILRM